MNNPGPPRRNLLRRGESMVAVLGLATTTVLLATLFGAAWWALREHRGQVEVARREQVQAAAQFLAASAETLLASGDLSGLRRLVLSLQRDHRLDVCRVMLSDGRILADTAPSRVQLNALPTSWPKGPLDWRPESPPGNDIVLTHSLLVPGRGPAVLLLQAKLGGRNATPIDLITGLGVVGIAGLLALHLVYRRLRARLTGVGLVREALLAFAHGERSPQALEVSAALGAEASAWNRILREMEASRQDGLVRSVSEKLDRRRESRSELELACESLSVGLAIVDSGGIVRVANGAAASLLKSTREEIAGRELVRLLDDPAIESELQAVFCGSALQRRSFEWTRQEQGLSSVLRVSIRPLRKEDSGTALVTIEDVTQQRVAEASRNSFVTQATHELRTPLTNMRLCLETALDEGTDQAVHARCFNILNQETRRLERVVTEMLSVAEIEAGAMKLRLDDVRMETLFDDLRADFEPLAREKGIALTFDLPPKFPVLQGDRDKLILAIQNLLGNAIKYTPEGGRVTVRLQVERESVLVEVADSGIGISPEERHLVFEKFYRAKDPRVSKITGSGLGLALTREVARCHGGDVTLHSELNHGSTFTLSLPVVAKAA